MKLVYLTTARIPDDWAHVLQILKMCEAFADAGADVELLAPHRARTVSTDPYAYGGVRRAFTITKLPCLDLFPGTQGKFLFWLRTLSFLVVARIYLAFRRYDVLYTREREARLLFRDFVYEVHAVPARGDAWYRRIRRRTRGIVVLTQAIRDRFEQEGIPRAQLLVAPDAVDAAQFTVSVSKTEARAQLSLPESAHLVGYVGTLKTMQMEKGVACAIDALRELPEDTQLIVVGGESADIDEYTALAQTRAVATRVRFVGKVPHEQVPLYLRAFDVVIAPFPDFEHYRSFMSPLKIFEYMASGVPMVVSDLPSLREVLSDATAVFIPPADAQELARAITRLRSDPSLAHALAEAALTSARTSFSWKVRAQSILAFSRS